MYSCCSPLVNLGLHAYTPRGRTYLSRLRSVRFVCSDSRSFQLDSLANIGSEKQVGTLSLALGMATDVVIAGALCWFLRGLRTGHRK